MTTLNKKALAGILQLFLTLAALLFIPAGTLHYWQAWSFLAVFFASTTAITVYLMKNDPALLERRVNGGPGAERETRQKVIQFLASIAFLAVIVLPAIDHRHAWSKVPVAVVSVGDALVALGLYIVFRVFRENSFAAATIAVAAEQRVISTGPYALVRHPMYSGALVMLVGVPLALGSWWGLLAVVPLKSVIVWRLLEEERFVAANLPGYREYCRAVRYRLVTGIW